MKLPLLSLEVINFNLEDTFLVLQGVSRYISSIFIREDLVVNEGIGVLKLLQSRYPGKKLVLDISWRNKVDDFIREIIKKTNVDFFVLSVQDYSPQFQKLCNFLHLHKKTVIASGQKIDLNFLKKFQIQHFFYHKNKDKKNKEHWDNLDLKKIKTLKNNNIFVSVGSVVDSDIEYFKSVWVDEFLVSEEVCYSFNPIQTCKTIYSKIKEHYLS